MRVIKWCVAGLTFVVLASIGQAQSESRARSDVRRSAEDAARRATEVMAYARASYAGDPNDAVLGINTSSSGERDTLGLLVMSVTPNSPADRAGLEEGNRIASVNGVNLRLAPEDAGERDMQGMTTRRLVREMEKVRPGDAVDLSVWKEGRYQTIRVQTVAREALEEERSEERVDADDRAVVGLTLQATNSIRDTLGPMVVRVAPNGPAERAGIVEGDRIMEVNGTSLRVSREDTEEPVVANARVNRFSRALRERRVGDGVDLLVYSGGQTRTVRLTTARAEEVYGETSGGVYFFRGGEGGFGGTLMPAPAPPAIINLREAPVAPRAPRVQVWRRGVI